MARPGTTHRARAFVCLICVVIAAACADNTNGSDSEATGYDAYVAKLRECGLLSDGDISTADDDPFLSCVAGCLATKPCDSLQRFVCEENDGIYNACGDECTGVGLYTCGNGNQIPEAWVCDLEEDCNDAADEFGCEAPGFQCGDGEAIPSRKACDGEEDCSNGADESACPAPFVCDGDFEIPVEWVCDLYADCADGTDEAECADLSCPEGSP